MAATGTDSLVFFDDATADLNVQKPLSAQANASKLIGQHLITTLIANVLIKQQRSFPASKAGKSMAGHSAELNPN